MATIHLCPETTSWLWSASTASTPADNDSSAESPRISFSNSDFDCHTSPPRLDGALLLSSPAPEFDFCVAAGVGHHDPPACAAELFSDGKLLPLAVASPTQIDPFAETPRWFFPPPARDQPSPPPRSPPPFQQPECVAEAGEKLKVILARREDDDGSEGNDPAAAPARASFWRFGRSKSLQVGESAVAASQKSGLLRSFQLLPRSKSTGSNPTNPGLLPNARKGKLQRHPSLSGGRKVLPAAPAAGRKPPSSSPNALARSVSCAATFYHNPPSSALSAGPCPYYYGSRTSSSSVGAVRFQPVLNIPTPYVLPRSGSSGSGSGSASGFSGIGFLLCNWKKRPQEL